ncbi:MAG TPA: hypothetical protein VH061_07870 [Solirubrobacteraceae bacterium]|jgi:hypothetical protein|nr:hypothetical protein [Solirubrobacteraceae bacterium]
MVARRELSERQSALIRWCAGLGVVTAEALAVHDRSTVQSARGRLADAERHRLTSAWRLLRDQPTIYTVTKRGLKLAGINGIEPSRVSAGGARHAILCCAAAVALESLYPDWLVLGEPAVRRLERESSRPLAEIGRLAPGSGTRAHHRPDLLLVDRREAGAPAVAVEVELTVKGTARLKSICLAWARSRQVAGVIYLAAPDVMAPLRRAIQSAGAEGRIVVLGLEALIDPPEAAQPASVASQP